MSTQRRRGGVAGVVKKLIDQTPSEGPSDEPATEKPSKSLPEHTPPSDWSGFAPIVETLVSTSPNSETSDEPSSGLTRDWLPPKNVREFASQTNQVATMVLRGEIALETAKVYSGLARTVAQAMSTEVSRARFIAEIPDLTFED